VDHNAKRFINHLREELRLHFLSKRKEAQVTRIYRLVLYIKRYAAQARSAFPSMSVSARLCHITLDAENHPSVHVPNERYSLP
jgi:hypothetical protein